jgi:hypothetical protein
MGKSYINILGIIGFLLLSFKVCKYGIYFKELDLKLSRYSNINDTVVMDYSFKNIKYKMIRLDCYGSAVIFSEDSLLVLKYTYRSTRKKARIQETYSAVDSNVSFDEMKIYYLPKLIRIDTFPR